MIFKINIVKVNDKYPKLLILLITKLKSLVTLILSKTYFKDIKETSAEYSHEFK